MIVLLVLAIGSSIYVGIRAIRDRRSVASQAQPATGQQAAGRSDPGYTRWSQIDDMQLTRLLQRAAQGE